MIIGMEYFAHVAGPHTASEGPMVLITVVWAALIVGILLLVVLALKYGNQGEPVQAKKPARKSSKE